ncbi:hypothetical protein CEY00_Acc06831 [Actinidia chinensis var. chinensis]|uniref:Uncharacterized protein n=1 Tax=Actinidia chinensis var. chinensis TaxID=1590841 RepID=A0A2R6Q5P7_ACTCC|nr:hypothetical protein CEY00_Acc06831 [Actinidia chinensis var. chinensis]
MDGIYEELDELKSEMEKLKEECRAKKELSESLRKAHNKQLVKYTETKSLVEEQAQQLNAKSEEISEARKICEDLKSSLQEKEWVLRHLNLANEKLHVEYGEKILKLEGENKALALALDEASARTRDCESKICAGNEEIDGLKRFLSVAEKKCLEVEHKAKASEELRQRDNVILKIEEENRNVRDQLKWKNEQFSHLEEAHERLQDQFQSSKVEWEREKLELLEEICSLQTRLASQTRLSESLRSQLKMCNQALSQESRRKILEVEVFELQSHFDNVILECQEAKSKVENLTLQRDEDIAELTNALGNKETLCKEMEYRIAHLEQENKEFLRSLNECRDAQIKNAGGNSLKKLQNKLHGLEQLHSQCSVNLKEKEAEWNSRLEKMMRDIDGYVSDLTVKDSEIQELHTKLEDCHCLLEIQNEEISIVIMVLKSEFIGAYSKLFREKSELELSNKERERKTLILKEQLEIKDNAVGEIDGFLEKERKEGSFFAERLVLLDRIKHQESLMRDELARCRKMFDELSNFQFNLEEQRLQMENALMQSSKDISYALERSNCEMSKKDLELSQTKLELQKWKASAEKMQVCLEESKEVLKQETQSLLVIVKEQDKKIGHLQQRVVLLESTIAEKMEAIVALKQEKENYYRIAQNKDCIIEKLQDALKTFEHEEGRLLKTIKEKDQSIEDLRTQAMSVKQNFESAVMSSFSVVTEKQIEIDVLYEDLETAEKDSNKTIDELKKELNGLRKKLRFQEESLLRCTKQVEELESVLEAQKTETETLKDQFSSKQEHLEGLVKELQCENNFLFEGIKKLYAEREDILVQMEEVYSWISVFSGENVEVMDLLERILQNSDSRNGHGMDLASDGISDSPNKAVNTHLFSSKTSIEESIDKRSPLKDLNG